MTGIKMVDITAKDTIHREATAKGRILLHPETTERIKSGSVEKGDPLEVSKIAGIMAAKETSRLVPMCHQIQLTDVSIDHQLRPGEIEVRCTVKAHSRTGVEMEALAGVTAALINIWDMVKKYEKDSEGQYPTTRITDVRVERKIKEGTQ